MLWRQIAEILMNEQDSIIYVAGIDDYKLIYMNARAKDLFGIAPEDDSYLGETCYHKFYGLDHPCEFCKNSILNKNNFYRWDSHSNIFHEHFYHRSKLISLEGKDYHFEIADILTERIEKQLEVEHQLETEKTLLRCIETLATGINVIDAINSLLEIVTGYYKGDRTYIFEINWKKQTISNTYEWAAPGVSKEIDSLQDIPLHVIDYWLKVFREKERHYISSVDTSVDPTTEEYEILQRQNIQSLMSVPLFKDNVITGFIGVDNPRKDYHDFTLLSSVTHFIQNDLEKRRVTEKLEKLSYEDSLTGLYNRNKYNHITEEYQEDPPSNLGIIYLDLNGLKVINDTQGHEEGDQVIKKTASIIRSLFRNDTYRIGGDEFVIILPKIPKQVFLDRVVKLTKKLAENQINASIGSNWRNENVDIIEQIHLADIEMYTNKEAYYNQLDAETTEPFS